MEPEIRWKLAIPLALLLALSCTRRGPEHRPANAEPSAELPAQLRRAFEPGNDFAPLPKPGPDDWLATFHEPGQSFEQFVHSRPHRPDTRRHKLYLQPLGEFPPEASPPLDRLRQFAAAFFLGLDVEILAPLDLQAFAITSRQNPGTGQRQLLTGSILDLLRRRLPDDAFALLGVTMVDLYPAPSWNFVFGQASLRDRVGVYSFARYDPRIDGGALSPAGQDLLLRRSCKVLAHETSHMFGIWHCTRYRCLMNGSNHLAESDAWPLHICPVDLRKLHDSLVFDPVERDRRLLAFSESTGFEDEAAWLRRRIAFVTGGRAGRHAARN